MKPLSNDLRERILNAVDHHEGSRRKLAVRFSVDVSTITRLLQLRRQTGSSGPRPHGGGVPPTLDPEGLERLRALVKEDPDATLETLKQRLGISGSIMIVWRALKKLGITVKKKSPHAAERDRPDVRQKRRKFRKEIQAVDPRRLVFVDETGVTTAMTPTYGRAARGE
jgi:transposase